MSFVPHSSNDIKTIFNILGIDSYDDLFKHIPKDLYINEEISIEPAQSELELIQYFNSVSEKNTQNLICFAGGGHYDTYLPHTVKSLTMRPEFMTSYTPYQAEISQGVLQALFEFQSMVADLTEMELANASLYDGATSVVEAVSMAIAKTKRNTVYISEGLNQRAVETLETIIDTDLITINKLDYDDDYKHVSAAVDDNTACVVFSLPTCHGSIQNFSEINVLLKKLGIISICLVDPSILGVVESPGKMGFDVVVSEGQSIGSPLSFGGPTVGWFATKKEFARLIPGRLIGESVDTNNNKAYIMTLRAREQDIRREKASSNICTNQTLNAIGSAIHLSWLGPNGLKDMGNLSMQKAHYLKDKLAENFNLPLGDNFVREFIVDVDTRSPQDVIRKMSNKGFLAGIEVKKDAKEYLLVSVTEKRTKKELDAYADALQEVVYV